MKSSNSPCPPYRLDGAVGRQFCAQLRQQSSKRGFQVGCGAVVSDDVIGPSGFLGLRKLALLPALKAGLTAGLGPLTTQGFVGDDSDRDVEPIGHLPLEEERDFYNRHRAVGGKGGKPVCDLPLHEWMDPLFQPGQLVRVSEDTLADGCPVNHTVGLDLIPPALSERRDHRLTIQQNMDYPIRGNRGGAEAPEGFERGRLAGGNAAGQPDG